MILLILTEPRADFGFLLVLGISVFELVILLICFKWGCKNYNELQTFKTKCQGCHLNTKYHTITKSANIITNMAKPPKG